MSKIKVISLVTLLLLTISAITIYYFFEKKDYETEDKQVDEVIDSGYSIQLPSDETTTELNTTTTIIAAGHANNGENTKNSNKSDDSLFSENTSKEINENTQTSSSNPINASTNEQKNKQDKPTVGSITKRYEPSFLELQTQANAKVDQLISIALEEYKTKKNNGEKISYPYFYSKYVSAAKLIEAETDHVFNQIYNALSTELNQNGFKKEEAKIYQDQYKSEKKARKTAILNRAKDALK